MAKVNIKDFILDEQYDIRSDDPKEGGTGGVKGAGFKNLCESVKQYGVLSAVTYVVHDDGKHIVDGRRRLLAADKAGIEEVEATEIQVDENGGDHIAKALIQNVLRGDMNAMEIAVALTSLKEAGHTQKEIGAIINQDASWVNRHLALLELPKEEQEKVRTGETKPTEAHKKVKKARKAKKEKNGVKKQDKRGSREDRVKAAGNYIGKAIERLDGIRGLENTVLKLTKIVNAL